MDPMTSTLTYKPSLKPSLISRLKNDPLELFATLQGRSTQALKVCGDASNFCFPELAPTVRSLRQTLQVHAKQAASQVHTDEVKSWQILVPEIVIDIIPAN